MQKLSLKQICICWLAFFFVGCLHITYRYRRHDEAKRLQASNKTQKKSLVYACWHQNALASILAHIFRRLAVLVSRSFDGEVIAFTAHKLGLHSARGSSSRGGREALRELIQLTHKDYEIGFTVDGPRGPRYEPKAGVISLASRTGVAILPLAAKGRRSWTLHKSWDHFRIPKPFTIVDVLYGEPIYVPSDIDEASLIHYQDRLKAELMQLEERLQSFDLSAPLAKIPMTEN